MLYTLLALTEGVAASDSVTTAANKVGGFNGLSSLKGMIPFLLMILVFWLLIIRPQAKKQKELAALLGGLKEDDRVITTSGIYGKVISIKPDKDIVVVEIDDTNKVRVQFQRGAIATILPKKDSQEN